MIVRPFMRICRGSAHTCQIGKNLFQLHLHFGRVGVKIHLLSPKPPLAIIHIGGQLPNRHMRLELFNERQEKLPVQTILIKIIRNPVRGGHHSHTGREKLLKQTSNDHRIGNVSDLHLIEGQQLHLRDDGLRHGHNRVFHSRLAVVMQGILHFLHKGVKMHPPFVRHSSCS